MNFNFVLNYVICIYFLIRPISNTHNTNSKDNLKISPFSRIKMTEDNIFFTLGKSDAEWRKLLSFDSIGSDAIVNFAKLHFGENNCDYSIPYYKFHIIVNFDKIYSLMNNGKKLPLKVSLESEFENKVQNGIDVECTKEKYENNQKYIENNCKESKIKRNVIKNNSSELGSFFMKGINKMKKNFVNLFKNFKIEDNQSYSNDSNLKLNQEIKNNSSSISSIKNNSGKIYTDNNTNLRKEIIEIKTTMQKIEKEEEEIKLDLLKDIQNLNSKLNSEMSIINSIWKREVIAGLVGALIVFIIFIVFYFFNGLVKTQGHHKKSIN